MRRDDLGLVTVCVGYAGAYVAEQSFRLHLPRSAVVPTPFGTDRNRAVPRFKCVDIVLAHLFFGGETFTELVEDQIGVDRGDAAYQDHKHPFHNSHLRSATHRERWRIV